jgi:hypothetical protein
MRVLGQRVRMWVTIRIHLLDGPRARVDVGAPQLGRQQMPAAEDVERQVAVAVVIAVEEAPLLMSVHRIVSGVEIKDDLLRGAAMRLQEQVDEQALDGGPVMADLVVARRLGPAQLQPVQRRLAGQRRAIRTPRRELAGDRRHRRVMAQLVMVVQVLVPESDAEHALADQRRHPVLDQVRPACIRKASREPPDQADGAIRRPKQQRPRIRGDRAAIERRLHPAAFDGCKTKQFCATLCRHRGTPLLRRKALSQKNFR